MVRTDGSFVAGYDIGGINSYYHSDDARNQTKYALETLVRSLTERSMRMQVRFEVVEGLGDLPKQYRSQLRSRSQRRSSARSYSAGGLERERGRRVLSAADSPSLFRLESPSPPRIGG